MKSQDAKYLFFMVAAVFLGLIVFGCKSHGDKNKKLKMIKPRLKAVVKKQYDKKESAFFSFLNSNITGADICDQIYLPYHTKDWRVPIKVYKKLNSNASEDKK